MTPYRVGLALAAVQVAILVAFLLSVVDHGAPAVVDLVADYDVCADPYADTVHIHAAMEPQ